MKAASFVLAAAAACAALAPSLLGCGSDTPSGQLTIVLQTDLDVPKDLDWIRIEVRTDGQPLGTDQPQPLHREDYVLDPNQPPDLRVTVPATFAVFDRTGNAEAVAIRVSAGHAGEAKIVRDSFTTVPSDRNAMLRVYLQWLAVGSAVAAPPGADPHAAGNACPPLQTNVAGQCVDAHVDAKSLPAFDTAAVFGGPSPSAGSALDVPTCFAAARFATPDSSCAVAVPAGVDAAKLNVGLALPPGGDGFCDSNRCIVPLDRQDDGGPPVGWQIVSGKIQLPPGVCARSPRPVVVVATDCPTKTASTPACGPDSTVPSCDVKGGPAPPPPPSAADVHWSLGAGNTCIVHTKSGSAKCWGANNYGEITTTPALTISPTNAQSARSTGVAVLATGLHATCAVESTGVECWGDNRSGELGFAADSADMSHAPGLVALTGAKPADVAVSRDFTAVHACAIGDDRQTMWCWGSSSSQELGAAPVNDIASFTVTQKISQMALGGRFTCILRGDSQVECWGSDQNGELGDGASSAPVARSGKTVAIPGGPVTAIGAGLAFGCAVAGGDVYCWGLNDSAQVTGDKPTAGPTPPTKVSGLPAGIRFLAVGAELACAARDDTTRVDCWGKNDVDQLGVQANVAHVTSALPMATPLTGLHAGRDHVCVENAQGAICWGSNGATQIADGTTQTLGPTEVHPP